MKRLALLLLALAALATCGFLLIRPTAHAGPGATVTAAPGAQSEPDIVSHWSCDEGSGTTASDSVDANNGTLDGATWSTGRFGNALSFDGNDRVVIPDNASLNPSTITVETWVKFDRLVYGTGGPDHTQLLVCKGGDQTRGWYGLGQGGQSSSSFHVGFAIDNASIGTPEMALQTNKWYHVAGTYDGITIKIYLDGVLQGSKDGGTIQVGNSSPLYFGYQDVPGWPYYLDGSLDEVAIYSRALTASEIQGHYQNGPNSPVGGIAELPNVSDSSAPNYIALTGGLAAALLALTTGAWYARRRWLE